MQKEDPEVHDMDELSGRENTRGAVQSGASPLWKAVSVVTMLLALAYDFSPIDLSPDAVPVLGWLDDIGFTITAGVNLVQQFMSNQNSITAKILRYIKWIMVILMVVACVMFLGLIAGIIALIKSLAG